MSETVNQRLYALLEDMGVVALLGSGTERAVFDFGNGTNAVLNIVAGRDAASAVRLSVNRPSPQSGIVVPSPEITVLVRRHTQTASAIRYDDQMEHVYLQSEPKSGHVHHSVRVGMDMLVASTLRRLLTTGLRFDDGLALDIQGRGRRRGEGARCAP